MKTDIRRTGLWALIPVKRLADAKLRLAGVLTRDERALLVRAMLFDVLTTLAKLSELDGVLLITRSQAAAALGQRFKADILYDALEQGTNAAVRQGLSSLAGDGQSRALVVPADVPFLTVGELKHVVDALESPAVVVVPAARDGGTNLLGLSPVGLVAPCFGEKSFSRHCIAARAARLEPTILHLDGASRDIDVAEDLVLRSGDGPLTRTRSLLRKFNAASRPISASREQGLT